MRNTGTKTIVLIGLFSAITVISGYLFLWIPNVELVTATIFTGGFLLGSYAGLVIGFVGELLLTLTNPYGTPAPPLAISQVVSMALVGGVGGLVGKKPFWYKSYKTRYLGLGLLGVLLTVFFDLLTTLSFAPLIAGWNLKKIIVVFLSGIPFYLLHWLSNFLIFAILLPIILAVIEGSKLVSN